MIHLYGLIIGIAVVIGMWLVEIKAKKISLYSSDLPLVFLVILGGGLIGARLYHVLTELSFYSLNPGLIIQVWEGGLSIIGGVMGGVLAAKIFLKFSPIGKKINFKQLLDLSVFGLPLAQALGRWGNYFNQELYGLPTSLPWGIYIKPPKRLAGYEDFTHFHPLFLYEMLLLFLFGGGVWWLSKQKKYSGFSIGSGKLFFLYLFYYSFIRFWLDFIRIDKSHFLNNILGINQLFLLGVMIFIAFFLVKINFKKK